MEKEVRRHQKIHLALAIAEGESIAAWAQENGVPERTAFYWAKDPKVRREVDACRRRALNEAVGRMTRMSMNAVDGIVTLAYDREQATKLNVDPANANTNANTHSNANVNANVPATNLPPSALPDPNTLVSFNPIISLNWLTEDQLYFQTAFVKRMKNDADSVMSFPRWHRLILTPQQSAFGR